MIDMARHRIIKKKVNRSKAGSVAIFIILGLFGVFFAFPLIFSINNALKPLDELFVNPPDIFVRNPTTDNFQDLFVLMSKSWVPFSRYIYNTLFNTIVGTVGNIFVCSMAAFVLAKYRFPGSKVFFRIVILALMFNGYVTSVPNYLVMNKLGWIDTVWSIVIPAFATPMGLFLMKQFMSGVPDALIEAAKIDGASTWRIFFKIVMPMVKPAWLTLMVFSVQQIWNNPAAMFIYSEELKTLPYALQQIVTSGVARAGVGAAVTLFIMVVPIGVFICAQSNVLETMANSGIKE